MIVVGNVSRKSRRTLDHFIAIVTAKYSNVAFDAFVRYSLNSCVRLVPIVDNSSYDHNPNQEETSQEQQNHFEKLSYRCLLKIFSYLDINALFFMASICTQFENVVRIDPRSERTRKYRFHFTRNKWKSCTNPEDWKVILEVQEMKTILKCIGNYINELSIELSRDGTPDAGFSEFFIIETMVQNVGPNLRTLYLDNFECLPVIFEYLSSSVFDQIKDLRLKFDVLSGVNVKKIFPNLEALTLCGYFVLIDFTHLSNIMELTLKGVSNSYWNWADCLEHISLHLPNLIKLSMLNVAKEIIAAEYFNHLLKLKKLKELEIDIVCTICFEILLQMTKLTKLIITLFPDMLKERYIELIVRMRDLVYLQLKKVTSSPNILHSYLFGPALMNRIREIVN